MAPEVFSFVNSSGDLIHGIVFLPEGAKSRNRLYPTLLKIYAGPHAQLVTNDYKFPKLLQIYLAVRMGYVVVMIDGRGSYNRGLKFESHLKLVS